MVQVVWIVTVAVELTAFTLLGFASFLSFMPGGPTGVIVVANILIALGIALGMVGGGVQSPLALATIPPVAAILLVTVSVFQWFGPGVKL